MSVLVVSALSLTPITHTYPEPVSALTGYARVAYTPEYPFAALSTDTIEISIELVTPVAPTLVITDLTLTIIHTGGATSSVSLTSTTTS